VASLSLHFFVLPPLGLKGPLGLTDLHLDEAGLLGERPRQDPGVAEARAEQHGHDEEEEHRREHGHGGRQVDRQVRASGRDDTSEAKKTIRKTVNPSKGVS